MKQIGILIPAILDPLQNELINSVYDTVLRFDYDVLVITNTTNAYDHFPHNDYTTGEENIFSLISSIRLDGIIFVSQDFKKTSLKQKIAHLIRKNNIPCVDTGGDTYGFVTVSIPQKQAIYDMTAHLIENHNCRDLGRVDAKPKTHLFWQNFTHTASRKLAGRQPTCVFSPCLRRNSAQKSALYFSVNTP